MPVTAVIITSELPLLVLTMAVLHTGYPGVKAERRPSLTQTGLCVFKFSCLSDFCKIQSIFSKNSILLDVGAFG